MISVDEDALICDFAETYHLFDYKRLPAMQAASFAVGLREDSRIKKKFNGQDISPELLILAAIVDRLNLLLWAQTKDASKGRNRPKSIIDSLSGETKVVSAYSSGKDFMEAREKIIKDIERKGVT